MQIYIEATNSGETTTNLTYVMMDEEHYNFIISETFEMWNGMSEYAGTEFWFRKSNIDGNDDLSFVAEWSWNPLSDYNGLTPHAFIIEDEMNFRTILMNSDLILVLKNTMKTVKMILTYMLLLTCLKCNQVKLQTH